LKKKIKKLKREYELRTIELTAYVRQENRKKIIMPYDKRANKYAYEFNVYIDKSNKQKIFRKLKQFEEILGNGGAEEEEFMETVTNILSQCDIEIKIRDKLNEYHNEDIGDVELMSIDNSTINNRFAENLLKYDSISDNYEITPNIIMNSYVSTNQKANACFYDIILNTYKDAIEKLKDSKGYKVYNFEMTYASLLRFFNEEECQDLNDEELDKIMNDKMPLTLNKSKKFFEKFHLNLCVINPNNKIIFKYESEKVNKDIFPNTLNLIYHNNHVYPVTINNNFTKIINTYQNKLDMKLEVSNK